MSAGQTSPFFSNVKSWEFLIFFTYVAIYFYFLLNVVDNCQYWLDLKAMKLTSPNYPKWFFADGIGCNWLLTAPEDHIIALEFKYFKVITIHFLNIYLIILENYR